jgi:dTDP-4-dehydrorhamnose 3,5-epimerase-like enzyme
MGQAQLELERSWKLLDLPKIPDHRGNLTFIEGTHHIPFEIERVYYVYDLPGGVVRTGHAHKQLQQFVIAIAGSFDVHVDDGTYQETVSLRRAYYGLYIKPMVWRVIDNFSSGAVCLVLASEPYEQSDYYRDYGDFKREVARRRSQ